MSEFGLIENVAWINLRAATENVAIGEVRYQPGGSCGPRIQTHHLLVLLHSGSCRVTINGERRSLSAGVVYLFQAGHHEYWNFSSDLETHHSWCAIRPTSLPTVMQQAVQDSRDSAPASAVWKQLLATALELRDQRSPAATWEIDFIGLALLAEFLNNSARDAESDPSDEIVSKTIGYMRAHLHEEDCLSGAQAAAGASRNVVIRRFQSTLQTTPSRFLWKLRTERGITMLRETGHNVTEIAYLCGFTNPFHFSRWVKKLQGLSPRDIRKAAWQTPS